MTDTAIVMEILRETGNLNPDAFYSLPEGLQRLWVEHAHNRLAGVYSIKG